MLPIRYDILSLMESILHTIPKNITEHVPLAPLTTFGIGGVARYVARCVNLMDIQNALAFAELMHVPSYVLSGGSNVLMSTSGYPGVIIHIEPDVYDIGPMTTVSAGVVLWDVIIKTGEAGYGGWEKLAGIPGTVGGAVRGNAGAFGTEISDVIDTVTAYNSKTQEVRIFTKSECDFSYRHSFFKDNPEWIITSASFLLEKMDSEESKQKALETVAERERRHIQNVACAGSFFMNPVVSEDIQKQFETEKGVASKNGRVPAGWLIEKAGMKGVAVGGALCSLMHPNYLVNTGTATSDDVLLLSRRIVDEVFTMFGVTLEREVSVL
jgi:UDP-N-acetylmuramate dehydrogenase